MIQDIAPLHLYNEFKNKKPEASSRMLGFGNRSVFLKYDENDTEITFLTYNWLIIIRRTGSRYSRASICLRWTERIIF